MALFYFGNGQSRVKTKVETGVWEYAFQGNSGISS